MVKAEMALFQTMYRSRSVHLPGAFALDTILAVSRLNNARDGITGYLIAAGPWFLQILEGDRTLVIAALERIRNDDRHTELVTIQSREIMARSFPEWSMAGTLRTSEKLAIFARYGLEADFDPRLAVAPVVFGLAMDLQDYERLQRAGVRFVG